MDAGDSLSSNDIRTRLSDAINDQYRGSGKWAYLIDSVGDAESGDVIYSCDNDTFRASYEMTGGAGAQKCIIDFSGADDVVPRTVYETEADEGEHLAAMESLQTEKLYGKKVPLYERFIGKSERDSAGSGSFAGKGKSFPILKAGDVAAAASSIGRAGSGNYSTDVIKRNIIRIAKEKGWTSELPKAWQDDKSDAKGSRRLAREAKAKMKDCPDCDGTGKDGDGDCDTCDGEGEVPVAAKESGTRKTGSLALVESCAFAVDIELREAFSVGNKIKLIAPGPGSTAYYTEAALKQAARDRIFAAGTPMRIDHPTKAEESARPEGSVKDWGAVLATDAEWRESHMSGGKDMGPGLYAEIKPFSDHARTIEEKGPYAGVSIRASGDAVLESSGRVKTKNGLPILEKFTSADGCDMVTRAGAGGLFLQESARGANQQEASMDAEELKLLRESVSRLSNKETRREAIQEGARILRDVSLPDAAKEYIIETVLKEALPMKDGGLDTVKFTESVNAEAKRFGGAIGAGPRVTGMGASAPVEITEAQRTAAAKQQESEAAMYSESWATLLDERPDANGKYRLAEIATRGRAN